MTKEYFSRLRKALRPGLSAFNKGISHKAFVVPVLELASKMQDWTSVKRSEI